MAAVRDRSDHTEANHRWTRMDTNSRTTVVNSVEVFPGPMTLPFTCVHRFPSVVQCFFDSLVTQERSCFAQLGQVGIRLAPEFKQERVTPARGLSVARGGSSASQTEYRKAAIRMTR